MKRIKLKTKKIVCSLLALICLSVSFSYLLNISFKKCDVANATIFSEDNLQNKHDYLPIDENTLSDKFAEIITDAPFDSKLESFREGKSITPKYDEYKQINFSIDFFNNKSLDVLDSLYVWVYIPGEPVAYFYDLSFTLYLDGGTIVWEFNYNDLDNMCRNYSGGTVNYGWKLFELSPSNNTRSTVDVLKISNYSLSSLNVCYQVNKDFLELAGTTTPPYVPSDSMSIYHIFSATAFSGSSTIISSLSYSSFKVKESFKNSFLNLYVGDSFTFGQVADIFDYVYVGKNDISNKALTGWKIEVENNGTKTGYDFGGVLKITGIGAYSFNIKYIEYRSNTSTTIVNYSDSFFVEQFNIGNFTMPDYMVEVGKTIMITFEISSGFILDGEVRVYSTSENIASVSYVKNGKTISVQVTAHKKGKANIVVEAQGHREGESIQNYSSKSLIRATSNNSSDLSMWILYIALGVFSAVVLIYFIISVVQARKNSVK